MSKSFYKIILLILFSYGLNADYTNGQVPRNEPPCNLYCFDSIEVAEIAKLILENDMLKQNEKLYEEKDSIYRVDRILHESKVKNLKEIITLKEEQIKKFEMTPQIITGKGWAWWQYALAAIGAVSFGFTAGIIYGMNH